MDDLKGSHAVLQIPDYLIVVLTLSISIGIGIYFRCSGGKQKTRHEFLMAGRDMAILPVAFSIMASGNSAAAYIGVPSDTYLFGTLYIFFILSHTVGVVLAGYIFLPVFFEMQVTTTYQYLEKRFGKTLRSVCSLSFSVQMVLYTAVALYTPALALSAVTNLSIWTSVLSIGVICTAYCALGGMKAVLWTDLFQAILMYVGLLVVVVKGCLDVGGISTVFQRSIEGGRLIVPGPEMDFTTRYTMMNIIIFGLIRSFLAYGVGQVQVQRMLTVRSVERSRRALFLHLPITVGFNLISCFTGLVIYANFFSCDPLTSGEKFITKADQLLPFFALKSLGNIPGLPGICICGMFSATLSTVSSNINSLTAVTMEDFIKPFCTSKDLSENKATLLAKAITLVYGIISVFLTYVVSRFGNVLQASSIVYGLVAGPVLGVFILGMFTTRANEKGTVIGLILALSFTAWISFGSAPNNAAHPKLPVSITGCSTFNSSYLVLTTPKIKFNGSSPGLHLDRFNVTILDQNEFTNETENKSHWTPSTNQRNLFPLHRISYMWFCGIGCIGTFFGGLIASFFVGARPDPSRELMSPIIRRCYFKEKKKRKESSCDTTSAIDLNAISNLCDLKLSSGDQAKENITVHM